MQGYIWETLELFTYQIQLNNLVLKIELIIYFPYSRRRNIAGELRKGVDTDNRLPLFKRKYVVSDTATPTAHSLYNLTMSYRKKLKSRHLCK